MGQAGPPATGLGPRVKTRVSLAANPTPPSHARFVYTGLPMRVFICLPLSPGTVVPGEYLEDMFNRLQGEAHRACRMLRCASVRFVRSLKEQADKPAPDPRLHAFAYRSVWEAGRYCLSVIAFEFLRDSKA